VHDDVDPMRAEVALEAGGHAGDREVADFLVALARPDVLGGVVEGVVGGIERVDALELEELAVREAAGIVHLSAVDQVAEDVERRGPGGHADFGACFGQGLGDREAEAVVVGNASHEGALAGQVD
jgi:hypothetical protein